MQELRHLTRTSVNVETKLAVEGLEAIKEVRSIKKTDNNLCLSVDTSAIGDVMNFLVSFGILKLECSPPTLEELFMGHYESKEAR